VYEPYDGAPVYPNRRAALPLATGERVIVTNNGSDTLSVLDLPAGSVLATVPIGRDPVSIDGPHHLAVGPQGDIYVALNYPPPLLSPGPHSAHSSSARSGYILALAPDDLRPLGEARVDENPGDVVVSDDGTRLVVTHFDVRKAANFNLPPEVRRATLAVLDPRQQLADAPEPVRIPVCLAPHAVALSHPDGATAYVACYGDDTLAVVDLASADHTVMRVPLGTEPTLAGAPLYGPYSAVLSPSGMRVVIGSTEGKDVRFFDTETRTMTGPVVATEGAPYFAAWTPDGAQLVVPTQTPDAVLVVDVATGRLVRERRFKPGTCLRPHEVSWNRDHTALYLVCEGDHVAPGDVLVLDPDTLATRVTVRVGVYPDRLVRHVVP